MAPLWIFARPRGRACRCFTNTAPIANTTAVPMPLTNSSLGSKLRATASLIFGARVAIALPFEVIPLRYWKTFGSFAA